MAAGRRSLKKELDDLRSDMRAAGRTWREIAAEIRERRRVNPRVAFRLAHGWTQDEVARRYNDRWPGDAPKTLKQVSYWENWEPGGAPSASARTPSHRTLDRLAQLYECSVADLIGGPDHGARDAAAQKAKAAGVSGPAAAHDGGTQTASAPWEEADPTNRRSLLGLGLAATVTPETLRAVLRDAAAEAMEFTRSTAVSGVGTGTLDHLDAVITELNGAYQTAPPAEQFAIARTYRLRVARLIEGRHTLSEGRRLYVCAAALDEALAWLAHDLSDLMAARAYAIDCYEHADQADHPELCAWASDLTASVAMYADRPEHAVSAARRGLRRIPDRHPMAVRLRGRAARAYARMGQREACEELFAEARSLVDRLSGEPPRRFTLDTTLLAEHALVAYSASASLCLGEYEKARRHAQEAIALHRSSGCAERAPGREAMARIDLGLALTGLGRPDEAIGQGLRALESRRHVHSLRARLGELRAALVDRYPDLPEVRGFDEQCREPVGLAC